MRVLVSGGGGFIAGHLIGRLLADGCRVRAVDIKPLEDWYQVHEGAQNWDRHDLRYQDLCEVACANMEQVYHLASDMGGMGYIESNRAACSLNVILDANMLAAAHGAGVERYLYASTACVYPQALQRSETPQPLAEDEAYPADPEDGYGWEKLYAERMARHFREDFGIETRIARFHTVYGPHETWDGGREKVPAALSRKTAIAIRDGLGEIEVWGDGKQARTFLYVTDAVEAITRLMASDYHDPVNVGSAHVVSVDDLARLVTRIAGVPDLGLKHVPGPLGVRGRAPDLSLAERELGWKPEVSLEDGMRATYQWVAEQVAAQ